MTINNDAFEDDFNPTEELIKRWETGDDVLSPPDDEQVYDEDHEADVEDDILSDAEDDADVDNEAETDEVVEDESKDKPKRRVVSDDDFVPVTYNGEQLEVPVKVLKRLHGQERAIQHRSKDLAIAEKTLADLSNATRISLESNYNRSVDRAKVWDGFDWIGTLKNPDTTPEMFNELRGLAERDYADVNYLRNELQSEVQRFQARQAQEVQSRIQATVAELTNPDTGIEGFDQKLGNDLANYALTMGVPQDRLPDLVHTPIMKIIYDGYRYRKSLAAKKATTPVVKTPTKIVKSTSNSESSRKAISGNSGSEARTRLAATGSREDAVKALLSGWQDD